MYSDDPVPLTSVSQATALWGTGSMLQIIASKLLPNIGSLPVTVYPTVQSDGLAVRAEVVIKLGLKNTSGLSPNALTFRVISGGVAAPPRFIPPGQTDLQLLFVLAVEIIVSGDTGPLPIQFGSIVAGGVRCPTKWEGSSGNGMRTEIEVLSGDDGAFDIVSDSSTGGSGGPTLFSTLDNIGQKWETLIVNGFGPVATDVDGGTYIDAIKDWGDDRWDVNEPRPAMVVSGYNVETPQAAFPVTAPHQSDRTNVLMNVPGSIDLFGGIAASAVAEIAKRAQDDPPRDYTRTQLPDLIPIEALQFFSYADRTVSVDHGVATVLNVGGVQALGDVVTMNVTLDGFRDGVDIVKLQNIIYRIRLIFESEEWEGAPLVPDEQRIATLSARKPKDAVAAIAREVQALALDAILSNPESAIDSVSASIDGANPKRLNVSVTVQLSGNVGIVSVDLNFGLTFS
ncbi:MAG: hypothetical protein V3W41_14460 [Planctomycetota bacterium]